MTYCVAIVAGVQAVRALDTRSRSAAPMDSQEHGVERTALAGACVNVVDSHVVVVVNVVNVVFVECTERLDQPSARGRHDTDEQQAGERRIVLSDMRQFAHALSRRRPPRHIACTILAVAAAVAVAVVYRIATSPLPIHCESANQYNSVLDKPNQTKPIPQYPVAWWCVRHGDEGRSRNTHQGEE